MDGTRIVVVCIILALVGLTGAMVSRAHDPAAHIAQYEQRRLLCEKAQLAPVIEFHGDRPVITGCGMKSK